MIKILKKCINFIKVLCFFGCFLMLFNYFSALLKPVWTDWNNYGTVNGFYEQPENTVSTVFLGASVTANAFIPIELYRDYGICAYNLGTAEQPMLASYYWRQYAYSLHPDTLQVAVLDVSMFRRTPDVPAFKRAIEGIYNKRLKLNGVYYYSTDLYDYISNICYLFGYHDRWSELSKRDYTQSSYLIDKTMRGYNFEIDRYYDSDIYSMLDVPSYFYDENVEPISLDKFSLEYIDNIVRFCENNGIKLVLVKTPVIATWSSESHMAIQNLADKYQLEFLDFNYVPYIEEIEYNHAIDSLDGGHMNYYGAHKLTKWFGDYLSEICGVPDIRGDERYAFLDDELEEYNTYILQTVDLCQITDPVEYIKEASLSQDNVVFLTVKDDAAGSLTDIQRNGFDKLGLYELSALTYRCSYYGVIDSGESVIENTKEYNNIVTENTKEFINNDIIVDLSNTTKEIFCQGVLSDGARYYISSGDFYSGKKSECIIDGIDYSYNERGINIVVYNKKYHRVIDRAVFDTFISSERSPEELDVALMNALNTGIDEAELPEDYRNLYLYNQRCYYSKEMNRLSYLIDDNGAYQFLEACSRLDDVMIIISVMDDAAVSMEDSSRSAFKSLGLDELSVLDFRDSYIGIIDDGNVIYEKRDHSNVPIDYQDAGFSVLSGGYDSRNQSSIMILNEEYSPAARGINIVVCSKKDMSVIATRNFDTNANKINAIPLDFIWEN